MEWSQIEMDKMEWNGIDGVEWIGMEWSGVEWNGVEWNGVEWNGMEQNRVLQCGMESGSYEAGLAARNVNSHMCGPQDNKKRCLPAMY